MLRTYGGKMVAALRGSKAVQNRLALLGSVRYSSHTEETDEEFDKRYISYFDRADIDGWEVRKAMNDLIGLDLVPDPDIIKAGFRACRRVNDIALAIRWLEACKFKCGNDEKRLYPYLMKHIQGTMDELGIPTLEQLNYDQPELALKQAHEI